MRKYQKAFAVAAMLGAVSFLGAGTAQASDWGGHSDKADVCVPTGGAGGAAQGGIGLNLLNINVAGTQTNGAGNAQGGAGGAATC